MDWYESAIEPGIRDMVRLLRDNGFNTECSCEGHDGSPAYVQLQCFPDGELKRLHDLLFGGLTPEDPDTVGSSY